MSRTAAIMTRIVALILLSGAGLAALPGPGPLTPAATALNVLWIQAPNGSGGDVYAVQELQRLGYTVTYGVDQFVKATDATGKDLVVISSNASRTLINSMFKTTAVPLMTWNSGLLSDMGMVGGTSGTDYGTTSGQSSLAIVTPSHPLAAGLTGTVGVLTPSTQTDTFTWGVPNGNAIKVSALSGNGTRYPEFAYESGAAMVSGTAPARRLGFFFTSQTMLYVNASGAALLDQAIRWTALVPPTGLAASPGDTRAQLRWTPTATATAYSVKRATKSGGPYTTVATNIPAPTFIDSGLTNGTAYYYVVSSLNNTAESVNSAQLTVTPAAGLTAPPNFAGVAQSPGSIKWTWTDTLDETYYVLHDASHNQIAALGPDTPYYTENLLPENTAVTRHVHAVNDSGVGPASSSVTRCTQVHTPAAYEFTLTATSGTGIAIAITPPPNSTLGSTGVQIERSKDFSTWTTIKAFSSTYSYVDSGLVSGNTYAYRITFRNQDGVAGLVSPVKATQPWTGISDVPQGIQGQALSSTSIQWSWVDVSNESSYLLHDDAHNLIATIPQDVTTYVETGLTENTSYSRHLHSTDGNGTSAATPSIAVATPVHDPTAADFTVVLQNGSQALITVTPPVNSTLQSTGVVIRRSIDQIVWNQIGPPAGQYGMTDTGLLEGVTYWYSIQYVNASGGGTANSPAKSVTAASGPPLAPGSLTGVGQSTTSIQWSWQDVPGETGFVLHDDAHNVKGTVGAGVTTFLETGLAENSSISRHVHATNAFGQSAAGGSVARWTQVHTPTTSEFTLTAAANGNQVTVTITPPPGGTTQNAGVTVQRTLDGVNWTTLLYASQSYTAVDSGLVGGQPVTYKIQFLNGDRSYTTPFSPPATITPPLVVPLTPGGFSGTVQSATSILWSWQDVANESGFKLLDAANGYITKATIGPSILSYPETALPENTSISRAIVATNASGASPYSGTATFYTRVHDPTTSDFTLTLGAGNQITVNVVPPPNPAVGYTGVQIDRSSDRINWTTVKYMSNVYTLTDTGLSGSTLYSYRIWFRNGNASYNSPYSPLQSVTTNAAPPATPASFAGTVRSTSSIYWSWADVDSETGFQILDSANGNAVKATAGAFILNTLETGIAENTSVTRTLVATNATGPSTATAPLTRVTRVHDPVASDFSLSVVSGSQVNVTVTPPVNGTTGYTGVQIDRSSDQVAWTTIKYMSNVYTASDINLVGGTKYYYRIFFRNQDASYNSAASPTLSATTSAAVPPTPTLSGTVLSQTSIQWSWNIVPNSTGYLLQDSSHTTIATLPAGTDSFTETSLSENTAYSRIIVAQNATGPSTASAVVSHTTWIHSPLAADFSLSGITATQINVTVTPPPNSTVTYTGVQIERSSDQVNWTVVKGLNNTYTVSDTGLIGGQLYTYRIWFRNGDAGYTTPYSPYLTATTLAGPPGAPSFSYSTVTPSSIQWTWGGVPAETSYVLHDASHNLIATIPANLTSYTETGLSENTNYTRHVHAVNASGQSPASTSVSRTTMVHSPTSADLTLTVVSGTQINVVVNPLPNPALGYTGVEIDRSADQVNWTAIKGVSSVYTANDTPLIGSTTYYYRILFRNQDAALTGYSAPVAATTTAAPPATAPTLSAVPLTTTSITWSWTNVPGVTRYELHNSSTNALIASTIPGQLTFTETGLSENTAYSRVVYAINVAGSSPASAAVSRYTRIHDPVPGTDFTAGGVSGAVSVTVTPPPNSTSGMTGVQIETGGDSSWSVIKSMSNVYTYSGSGGNEYRIWFRNGDASYTSAYSGHIALVPPTTPFGGTINAPVGEAGTALSPSSILWSWQDFSMAASYSLLVNGVGVPTVPGPIYLSTGLPENTSATFQVSSNAIYATDPGTGGGGGGPVTQPPILWSTALTRMTRVHDPGVGDFTLTNSGNQVIVAITPPPNSTTGYTGSYIERSIDQVNWNYISYWSPTYSFVDANLVGGVTYSYRISFRNQDASYYSLASPPQSIKIGPVPPPGTPSLSGTVQGMNSILWSWSLVPGATAYTLFDSTNTAVSPVLGAGVNSWLQTGIAENTTLTLHLVASNAAGAGPSSTALARTTFVHTPLPADFTLTQVAGPQINVTVTPPPNGSAVYTGVQIERSLDQLNWTVIKYMSNVYTVSDPNLEGSVPYYYRIYFRNQDASYSTSYSLVQSLGTAAAAPGAPTGLAGQARSTSSIAWSWTGDLGATGYVLHDDAHNVIATISTNVTYVLETGLAENTVASRHVHAVDATGAGSASATVAVATKVHDPLAGDFTLTPVSGSQVTVTVTPPPNPAVQYTGVQIQRSIDMITWTTVQYMSSVYTFNDLNLIEGTPYFYQILFRNSDARFNTVWSPVKSVTTTTSAPLSPGSFTGTIQTATSILWTWQGVLAATGYALEDQTPAVKATVGAGVLSYLETGLPENTSITREIGATNASGTSTLSAPVTIITRIHDPIVTDFSLTVVGGNQVNITTTVPPNSTVGYTGVQIERSTDKHTWGSVKAVSPVYTYSDTGLLGGTTYYYRIWYRNQSASYYSATSPVLSVTTQAGPPNAPNPFYGTVQSSSSILWSWTDVPIETGFVLHDDAHNLKATIGAGVVSTLETSLPENTLASRHVHATNAAGQSPATTTVAWYTQVHTPVVSDLTLTVVSATQINVSVTQPPNATTGSTGCQIQRSSDGINWGTIKGQSNTYTVSDTNLIGGRTYYYRVQYLNGDARYWTPWSPPASASTPAAAPGATTSFTGTAMSTSSILWTWNDVPAETGWVLHDDAHNVIATLTIGLTTYLETGLSENFHASRHIHGTNAVGTGPASATYARYTLAHTPTTSDLTLSATSGTSVLITTTALPENPPGSTGFQFERSTDGGVTWGYPQALSQVFAVTDSSLYQNTNYTYKVVYYNGDGIQTSWSPPKTVRTPAGPPLTPTYLNGFPSSSPTMSITWSWSSMSGATGYTLYDTQDNVIANVTGSATSYKESVLENSIYNRYIIATNASGSSPPSAAVKVTTPVHNATSGDFFVLAQNGNTVIISATPPLNSTTGTTGIQFFRSTDGTNFTFVTGQGGSYAYADTVSPKTTYWYKIAYNNQLGTVGGQSPAWKVTTPIATPSNFSGVAQSTTSMLWSWSPIAGATSFTLTDSTGAVKGTATGSANSILETGLTENTSFLRNVTAADATGPGASAAAASVTLVRDAAAGSFSLSSPSATQVTVTVVPPPNPTLGLTGCEIQRLVGTTWTTIQTFAPNYTYADTGRTASTSYSYRIRYQNGNGIAGAYAPTLSVTTQAPPPAAPAGFHSTASTTTSITWAWTAAATAVTYQVRDSSQNVKGTVSDPTVTLTESSLTENLQVTRHVDAINPGGTSPDSSSVTMRTQIHQAGTGDFFLGVASGTQVNVTVTAPPNSTSGSTGVQIQRSPDNTTWTTIKAYSNAYTYSDTALTANTTYYYRIQLRNGDGVANAAASASLSVKTAVLPAPTGLAGTAASSSSIKWTWTNLVGNTGYQLQDGSNAVKSSPAANAITVTETGLSENTQYTRHLVGMDGLGAGTASANVLAYSGVHNPGTGDFKTSASSPTQIDITVTPPPNKTSGSTGCLIQRSVDGTTWTTLKAFSNVYTASDTSLTTGTKYWYRIQFQNGNAVATSFSASRTEVSVSTPVITTASHKLKSHTPLIQGTVGSGASVVTVTVGSTSYAATLNGTTWSLTTPSIPEGAYTVTAQAAIGTYLSSVSNSITLTIDLTPPAPPTNIRTKAYSTIIDVEWDPSPSTDIVGYLVYRKIGATGTWSLLTGSGVVTGTKYRDSSLTNGVTYFYHVTAVDNAQPN
jgi:titin